MSHCPLSLVEFKQAAVCCPSSVFSPSPVFLPPSSVVRRPSSGFTLIELLVVIVVIAILMGITIPVSKYAIARAKAARQEVMLAKIRSALDDYRAAYGEYPITPITNDPGNPPEAKNHYGDNLTTNNYSVLTNWLTPFSPITNVGFVTDTTLEDLSSIGGAWVDYSLTFPLMIRPMIGGKRPFYTFPDVTVVSLAYKRWSGDLLTAKMRRKGGAIATLTGLYGAQINRPKAVDPVSLKQWKYECRDGTSYTITTNNF